MPARAADDPQGLGRRKSLPSQVFLAGLGTVSVAALTVLATHLYAQRFGAEQVSAILIYRLAGSLIVAIATMGMPIAIQRNVAMCLEDRGRAAALGVVGVALGAVGLGIACGLSALLAPAIARWTHHPHSAQLWVSFATLTWSQGLVTMFSCFALAQGRVRQSAGVVVAGFGAALILPLWLLPGAALESMLIWSAAFALIACIPPALMMFRDALPGLIELPSAARRLLRYGVPRVVANVLEPTMDLLLPAFAMFSLGFREAGFLAAGLALMRPLNPIVTSLNMVCIPDSARLAATGNTRAQRSRALLLSQTALHCGIFATLLLAIWCDVLLRLWLGPGFTDAAGQARVLAFALLPAIVYGTAKGVIDGENERAVNSINLLLSFLLLMACAWLFHSLRLSLGIALAYVISRSLQAFLSLRHLLRSHDLKLGDLGLGMGVSAAALCCSMPVLLRLVAGKNGTVLAALSTLVAAAAYLAIMRRRNALWLAPLRAWLTPDGDRLKMRAEA